MNDNKEMITYRRGLIDRLHDTYEIIKSKINKNYALNSNSPRELQENTNLIINTLRVFPEYIHEIIPSVINDNNKMDVILKYCFQQNFSLKQLPKQYFKRNNILSNIIKNYLSTNQSITDLLNHIKMNGVELDTFFKCFNDDSKQLIVNNPQILQEIFEHVGSVKASSIIENLFSNEELSELFNTAQLPHDIKKLQDLYKEDPRILKDIDIRMLSTRYDNIPLNKLHLFTRIPEIQQSILKLNDLELALYYKMSNSMATKTDNWFEYENNILQNFSNGNFNELLNDLYGNAVKGNKINAADIDSLTNIFSSRLSGNLFNITTKTELEQFNEIKQHICDIILQNPKLDNADLISGNEKHMKNFRQLDIADRCKTAILQKYYNISLSEAVDIINTFGKNILEIPCSSDKDAQVVEIVTALRNICECDNIESLMNIGNLNINVSSDLSHCVILEQECKELYGRMYQEKLYHPNENDFSSSTEYNGKKIDIYKLSSNFEGMIAKRVSTLNSFGINIYSTINDINFNSYHEAWDDLGNNMRFRSSMSYMTPETLLTSPHGNFSHRIIYNIWI